MQKSFPNIIDIKPTKKEPKLYLEPMNLGSYKRSDYEETTRDYYLSMPPSLFLVSNCTRRRREYKLNCGWIMKSFKPNNMMKIERVKNIFFCFVPGPATDNSGLSIWLLRKNSVQGGAIVHNLHRNNLHRKKPQP